MRRIGPIVALVLALAFMHPLSAGVNGKLDARPGTMEVGTTMPTGCPKSGLADPDGKGLGSGVILDQQGELVVDQPKNYGYWLTSAATLTGTNNQGVLSVYSGSLSICGFLTEPIGDALPFKATCLGAKGHHGRGHATFVDLVNPANIVSLKLFNINWKLGLKAVAITGNYEVYEDTAGTIKKDKPFGSITGTLTAIPNAADGGVRACLENRAKKFDTTLTATLFQDGIDRSKGGDKKCPEGVPDGQCQPGSLKGG